jgi:hypothetical protein
MDVMNLAPAATDPRDSATAAPEVPTPMRRMRSWRRGTRSIHEVDVPPLSEECEAFLSGSYRALLEANGWPIPAWAWLNGLAHGDLSEVERMASRSDPSCGPDACVADMANQVLVAIARTTATLATLQQRLLVPLEMALIAGRPGMPRDASDLRGAVRSALAAGIRPLDGNF